MSSDAELEARVRNVLFEVVGAVEVAQIKATMESENMEVVLLGAAAIYRAEQAALDDAVTWRDFASAVLEVYDRGVLGGRLRYDWLHLPRTSRAVRRKFTPAIGRSW
jgi:hypothetical protein